MYILPHIIPHLLPQLFPYLFPHIASLLPPVYSSPPGGYAHPHSTHDDGLPLPHRDERLVRIAQALATLEREQYVAELTRRDDYGNGGIGVDLEALLGDEGDGGVGGMNAGWGHAGPGAGGGPGGQAGGGDRLLRLAAALEVVEREHKAARQQGHPGAGSLGANAAGAGDFDYQGPSPPSAAEVLAILDGGAAVAADLAGALGLPPQGWRYDDAGGQYPYRPGGRSRRVHPLKPGEAEERYAPAVREQRLAMHALYDLAAAGERRVAEARQKLVDDALAQRREARARARAEAQAASDAATGIGAPGGRSTRLAGAGLGALRVEDAAAAATAAGPVVGEGKAGAGGAVGAEAAAGHEN